MEPLLQCPSQAEIIVAGSADRKMPPLVIECPDRGDWTGGAMERAE